MWVFFKIFYEFDSMVGNFLLIKNLISKKERRKWNWVMSIFWGWRKDIIWRLGEGIEDIF